MLTQLASIKGRKSEKPLQRKKQICLLLLKSITLHSQKTGARCMILATPTWSWGGTILRKVMLDRQSDKSSLCRSFRSNLSTASSTNPCGRQALPDAASDHSAPCSWPGFHGRPWGSRVTFSQCPWVWRRGVCAYDLTLANELNEDIFRGVSGEKFAQRCRDWSLRKASLFSLLSWIPSAPDLECGGDA